MYLNYPQFKQAMPFRNKQIPECTSSKSQVSSASSLCCASVLVLPYYNIYFSTKKIVFSF
jgi:hypothetical protein